MAGSSILLKRGNICQNHTVLWSCRDIPTYKRLLPQTLNVFVWHRTSELRNAKRPFPQISVKIIAVIQERLLRSTSGTAGFPAQWAG